VKHQYINQRRIKEKKMSEFIPQSVLDIVKAQASVRPMSEDEIIGMVVKLKNAISGVEGEATLPKEEIPEIPAHKGIKANSVTCLECGKTFKLLTKRHLATHDLTAAQYREKYGFKRTAALVCKNLQKARKEKMKSMQLWKWRGQAQAAQAEKVQEVQPAQKTKVRAKKQPAAAEAVA
jgi:predicted transcriptional regulator